MGSWGYGPNNGPSTWGKEFPIAVEGQRQSPIDIVPKSATFDPTLNTKPLTADYVAESNMEVSNTGSSVKAQMTAQSVLKGGPLKDVYRLEQFHLHWGSKNDHGSEHTVNGHTYASELHLVHWNADKYKSFGEAAAEGDGLAVLGIFIKAGKKHDGFAALTDVIEQVKCKNKTAVIPNFKPACLLPKDLSRYWTYPGSLTTPPLLESVTWIVVEEVMELSEEQLATLRCLCFDECGGETMVDNYRPPLPLGKRLLRASFQ